VLSSDGRFLWILQYNFVLIVIGAWQNNVLRWRRTTTFGIHDSTRKLICNTAPSLSLTCSRSLANIPGSHSPLPLFHDLLLSWTKALAFVCSSFVCENKLITRSFLVHVKHFYRIVSYSLSLSSVYVMRLRWRHITCSRRALKCDQASDHNGHEINRKYHTVSRDRPTYSHNFIHSRLWLRLYMFGSSIR